MIENFVTKWREAKGVSKAHLARRVGVSRSYMTKLEQDNMQPSGEMMFRIAEYLEQPLEVVFQHKQANKGHQFFSGHKCCLTDKHFSRPPSVASGNKQQKTPRTMKGK
jgi:transcriptional regulator with XRE-family HTH domain